MGEEHTLRADRSYANRSPLNCALTEPSRAIGWSVVRFGMATTMQVPVEFARTHTGWVPTARSGERSALQR